MRVLEKCVEINLVLTKNMIKQLQVLIFIHYLMLSYHRKYT